MIDYQLLFDSWLQVGLCIFFRSATFNVYHSVVVLLIVAAVGLCFLQFLTHRVCNGCSRQWSKYKVFYVVGLHFVMRYY